MIKLIKEVAKAYNTLNHNILDASLDDGIIYESQNVLNALKGKQAVMEYLEGKFETIRKLENHVYAELGFFR
ncbi:MAG: hypothetical protein KDC67_05610 [Ignavibacteriae bacterium]|nr:hypothetical protein [Ignavibacteriota bacterium]